MKRIFVFIFVVGLIGTSAAHAQKMRNGMSLFNVGIGLVPGVGLNASYDYGLINTWGPGVFTVGGFVGFQNWGKTHPDHHSDYRTTVFAFSPRATYRYAINDSFEVYGTVMLGALIHTYSKHFDNATDVYFATTVGCRFTFARNVSVFAEMGYNIAILNGGLSFSF